MWFWLFFWVFADFSNPKVQNVAYATKKTSKNNVPRGTIGQNAPKRQFAHFHNSKKMCNSEIQDKNQPNH